MSPLLGSTGGSSEYAYRGTLDDWPNPFETALSAQNIIGTQNPAVSATAILTVTGLNYKARVTVENDNATLSVDGGVTYVSARSTDAAVFTRDNNTIRIRLQPTSGTLSDFNKSYTIPVKIGKRQGTWEVSTRSIDETPDPFIFNGLLDQQLGVTTTSNSVTIAGLEAGFSFPISAFANQTGAGTTINIYKNGSLIGVSGTVANSDQIYLSTQTINSYNVTRTFTVQVGTFTTTWGLITRNAITTIDPFSFTGISSANQLGFGYTSGFMTVNGADSGPADPSNPNTWPTDPAALLVSTTGIGSFQIIKSDGSLRYNDPLNLAAPTYFQTGSISTTRYAFNGDKINVKLPSSASYNTTTTTTLSVSDKSAAFIVTTRPAPIDSIPQDLNSTFTDFSDQGRGVVVTSGIVTLTDMIVGSIGTASIPSASAGVSPQFNINGSATWISPPTTASVQNGDTIRLRMTTPVVNTSNGVTNNTLTIRVDGVDTQSNNPTPTNNPEGYTTVTASQEDIWNVSTIARTCSITPFSVANISDAFLNSAQFIDFAVDGYNSDCQMNVTVTSTSNDYNFTQLNGSGITTAKTLSNVSAGSTVRLLVRSSPSYVTGVASTITVSNSASGVTPSVGFNTSFTVTTVADDTPWALSLSASPTTIGIGETVALTWSSTNCTSIRSVSWSATPPTNLNGSTTQTPASTGSYIATITAYVNSASSTYTTGTTVEGSNRYATATATVTVNEDYIPTITPSTILFSSPTDAEPSTAIPLTAISSLITVSGISAPIVGIVTDGPGGTGAAFFLPNDGATVDTNITDGTGIRLKLNTSTDFLTTTSAFIDFTDPLGNPVAARREFRVTTRECIPDELSVSFGSPTQFSATYYLTAQFTNPTGGTITDNLLKSRPPTDLVATTNATTYYNGILAGSGFFTGAPTTTVPWSDLVAAIWDAFTLNAERPPSISEISSLLNALSPSSYTGIAEWRSSVLDSAATSNPNRVRDTATPILNSCVTRAATVGTIKTGAY